MVGLEEWGKIVKSGLAAGIVMLVISVALMPVWSTLIPGQQAEYENEHIFRPWSDPLMSYVFVHPFVLGLLMAYAYTYFGRGWKKKSLLCKGTFYGLLVWLVGGLPGMLMTISSFQLSNAMVLSWTVQGLIATLAGGFVIVKLWEKK